jgi:anti-sigma regulatory factor (Ser/Thr protein kinase)
MIYDPSARPPSWAPPRTASQDAVPDGCPALDQLFDSASLYALRAAVAAHAAAAGLSQSRVYDAVVAAHELAANAVRHGAGHGRLRLWAAGRFLYCQVSDDGPAGSGRSGNQEPDPGDAVPWPIEYGHGLWVVGQVTDQFSLDRGPAGTTAAIGFIISPPRQPPQ